MYHSITIRRLRGFRDLEVAELRRVNLIVGKNGSGKTTLLEAIALLDRATDPAAVANVAATRAPGQELPTGLQSLLQSFFPGMDLRSTVEVSGQWDREPAERRLEVQATEPEVVEIDRTRPLPLDGDGEVLNAFRLTYAPADGTPIKVKAGISGSTVTGAMRQRPDLHPAVYLTPVAAADLAAQHYGSLVKLKQTKDLISALQQAIVPGLQDIAVVPRPGGSELMVDLGLARMLPAGAAGGGFGRLFGLLTGLRVCAGGVLLLDEIETGLHHSVYGRLWKLVDEATSRFNVQVFATTHSDELLRSALRHFAGSDDLAVIRMGWLPDGRNRAVHYDREMREAVLEAGFEVRG